MSEQLQKYNNDYILSKEDINTLVQSNIIPKDTPEPTIKLYAKVCSEKNLSPFSRQIHLVARGGKYTIQTGIDGYRSIAERTGKYAGNDDYRFDEGLTEFQMISEKRTRPTTATATIYKIIDGVRCPFSATARWEEYFPGEQIGFMWKKMPYLMLGKCAEALALRKTFPEALSGIYTDEEMAQAGKLKEEITEAEIVESKINYFEQAKDFKTMDEVKQWWNELDEQGKKDAYKAKESAKARIVEDDIEDLISKLKTNTYEKNALTIETCIDHQKDPERKKYLIELFNSRLEKIGVDYRYQPLIFDEVK